MKGTFQGLKWDRLMVLSFPGRIAEADPPLVWISTVQYGIFTTGPHVQEDFSLTLCSSFEMA